MKYAPLRMDLLGTIFFAMLTGCAMAHSTDTPKPTAALKPAIPAGEETMYARSLVSPGDPARLDRVLAKARRGEPLTVAVIGGSITEGALASSAAKCWASLTARWWRERFPQAKIEFFNAGIGATGSDIGAHRVQKDLLAHHPDFIVVEFAANDGNETKWAETLEGLLRQILKQPNHPAVMLFFTMHDNGDSAQQWHTLVGRHYGLPMVSYRDALWPEVRSGRMKWSDISPDVVHPNDRGHAYCAAFIGAFLDRQLAALPAEGRFAPLEPLPAPLFTDLYEHTDFYDAANLQPKRNEGWITAVSDPRFGPLWSATRPGSVLEFEVEGTVVSMIYRVVKAEMGMAEVQLDDGPTVKLNGWFKETWGTWNACQELGRDLSPGKHKVRITVLNEKDPASAGHRFDVQAIMVAGTHGPSARQ